MSDSDSFIEEVTEEVRRDRLFALMRKYGWIAILAVLLLVGGAAWNEWQKAQERNRAEALGDAIESALAKDDADARAKALESVTPDTPDSGAVIAMMAAAELVKDDPAAAAAELLKIADDNAVDPIYREIAVLKAVMIPDSGLDEQTRRDRLDGLMLGSDIMRLLATEQLAYLDIAAGDTATALKLLNSIVGDAGATPGLRRRATQVIVALGGDVDLPKGLSAAQGAPDGAAGAAGAGDTASGGVGE